MSASPDKSDSRQADLGQLLLDKKIITEGQLKAAFDYRKSVGGEITDILVKLGMIRRSKLANFLQKLESGSLDGGDDGPAESVLDPAKIEESQLKIHHLLLEKLSPELVEENLVIVFFPTSGLNSRKLILGHGRELSAELQGQVRKTVGVDLYSLALSEDAAQAFLDRHWERVGRPKVATKKSTQARPVAEAAPAAEARKPAKDREPPVRVGPELAPHEATPTSVPPPNSETATPAAGAKLDALIGLLVKKQVISPDELAVEMELSKYLNRG